MLALEYRITKYFYSVEKNKIKFNALLFKATIIPESKLVPQGCFCLIL